MQERPNLLFIYTNSMRYDGVGFNGNTNAYTPCLDALFRDGVVFDNAVSGQPLETPFAAALYTGKYSVETGAVINEVRLSPNHATFAGTLAENGYDTLFFGRWHLYAAQLGHYNNVKNSYVPQGEYRLGFNTAFGSFNDSGDFFAPRSYYHTDSPAKLYTKGFEPDFQTELALEKLSQYASGDKPFAMFLSFGAPGGIMSPDNTPAEYYEMFKNTEIIPSGNYCEKNDPHADIWSRFFGKDRNELEQWQRCAYAMNAAIDADVGRLVGKLKSEGLFDNTVIVFTSSRGEMFGSHGRRSANIFYEEAVRVPFAVCCGEKLHRARVNTPLNTPDIMPTVLSLLGVKTPDGVSGRDLSAAAYGKKTDSPVGSLLLGTGPAAIWGDGREWRGIRTEKFTYAVYLGGGEFLFDNIDDPLQMNNLADNEDYSDTKEELRNEMLSQMEAIGDSFEKNSYYKKNFVVKRKIKSELPKKDRPEEVKDKK